MTPDQMHETYRRAELFLDSDQPTEAALLLAPLAAALPDDTAVLELHARALFSSAQLPRAELALRALVARRPDDGWAHLALARVLERQSRPDEAATTRRLAAALGQPA